MFCFKLNKENTYLTNHDLKCRPPYYSKNIEGHNLAKHAVKAKVSNIRERHVVVAVKKTCAAFLQFYEVTERKKSYL